MHFRSLALVAFCSAFLVQAAEKLVGGPYVVNVTPRGATIGWVVETSDVRVGDSPDKLTRAVPVLRSQKVSLSGLKPGATIYYDTLGTGEGKGSFRTPPAGPANFQFLVYGDTRSRHDMHQRVVDAMVKSGTPDFVLHTGDLVADGNDMEQWPRFFGIERELLRKTVFFPSIGNHERNNPQFREFFGLTSPYYSFDWGSAHFTVLATDIANIARTAEAREAFWKEQMRWMEEDLARAQKADFRFVLSHHPPFTAYGNVGHMSKEAQMLPPLMEKYKVAAIFSGHDHTYQHHLKNGVRYIISGGGGAPLNHVNDPIEGVTVKAESTEHFVRVNIEGKQAALEAVGLDGRTIDRFEIGQPQ